MLLLLLLWPLLLLIGAYDGCDGCRFGEYRAPLAGDEGRGGSGDCDRSRFWSCSSTVVGETLRTKMTSCNDLRESSFIVFPDSSEFDVGFFLAALEIEADVACFLLFVEGDVFLSSCVVFVVVIVIVLCSVDSEFDFVEC